MADLLARLARIERATAPPGTTWATALAHEQLNADIERLRERLTPQQFDAVLAQVRQAAALRATGKYGF